jgi:hypothetical protein
MKKKIEELVAKALAIDEQDDPGAIAYIARGLIQATLPHSKTSKLFFTRQNGNYTLSMTANPRFGLPYGSMPRLLLCWLADEAVKTRKNVISMGDTLTAFLEKLGLHRTGGQRGDISRLKNQITRLFTTGISCVYDTSEQSAIISFYVAERVSLWWTPKTPEQLSLWENEIVLSNGFFEEILNAPVPIRLETLRFLKSSPWALDIYNWCTYRNSYAKKSTVIPYEALQNQFGAGYPMTYQGKRDFKKKFLAALKKVAIAYPEAGKLRDEGSALLFVPGRPDVPPKKEVVQGSKR